MSFSFVAFCFIKNITRNNKCISETALYQINHNINKFREITFKGFIASSESLVVPFKKNSIILMIRRYVYKDAKYVTIVQIDPIFSSEEDYILTPKDFLSSSLLLIYSATIIANFYIPDNQDSLICYRSFKDWFKKFLHILVSDIEWTYVSNDPLPSSTTTNVKGILEVEFNEYFNGIEEKYAILTSQVLQKRQNTRQILICVLQITNDKEEAAFISGDNSTELIEVRIQEAMPEIKEKYRKNFHSSKK
ncbi:hypothetical protein F8M41_017336 [Gigaspora margarita]|uniref:Uncharacterized protein n=1 Tax=Gigaspora margarita TaxID=4874 RepID=A0A8H4EM85_GIGMA|nr:hypothetical protein F8M41_017336 [Gigaspora margarita]